MKPTLSQTHKTVKSVGVCSSTEEDVKICSDRNVTVSFGGIHASWFCRVCCCCCCCCCSVLFTCFVVVVVVVLLFCLALLLLLFFGVGFVFISYDDITFYTVSIYNYIVLYLLSTIVRAHYTWGCMNVLIYILWYTRVCGSAYTRFRLGRMSDFAGVSIALPK